MKTVKFIIVAVLVIFLGSNSYAQMNDHSKIDIANSKTDSKIDMASTKTETLKVSGNCDLCKSAHRKSCQA